MAVSGRAVTRIGQMTALIHAHGKDIAISASGLSLYPHALAGALGDRVTEIPVGTISSVTISRPATNFDAGEVEIAYNDGTSHIVCFPPRYLNEQRSLVDQMEALLGGDAPSPRLVPGLSFVALDVETANDDWGSICQIGVVRFRDGDIVDTAEWLCTPPPGLERFDEFNVSIHGITADQVKDSPSFAEVLPQVMAFVGELPVVAHNAQFDMTALFRATRAAGIDTPTVVFGCSLAAARAASLPIDNHKLPTVARFLEISEFQHHDALADAKACGRILVELARRDEVTGELAHVFEHWKLNLGKLTPSKVHPVLRLPVFRGPALNNTPRKNDVEAVAASQPDPTLDINVGGPIAMVSSDDQAQPKNPVPPRRSSAGRWAKAAAPDEIPETNTDADPADALFAQTVVLTGDFAPFDKGLLWREMAKRGAIIAKGVTKKTTMLVIGPWDSVTGKQKRAEELIAKGQLITLWSAKQLFDHLGLDAQEEPPF